MFGRNGGTFVSRQVKRKVFFVLAFWLISLSLLYTLSRDYSSRSAIAPAVENALSSVSHAKNELGRCRFGLYDPDTKQAVGAVSFERLKTDSVTVGVFKTAVCRAMEIQHLKIDLLSSPLSPVLNPTVDSANAFLRFDSQLWSKTLLERFCSQSLEKNDLLRIPLPDFSHLVQMRINDFQCRFIKEQSIPLSVQSKKAFLETTGDKNIILRGCVVLQTPTTTLQTNRVRWNVQNQTFEVQGFYLLRTDGAQQTGCGGLFDPALNRIETRKTVASKGE